MDNSLYNPMTVSPFKFPPGLVQSDGSPSNIPGQPAASQHGTPQPLYKVSNSAGLGLSTVGGDSDPMLDWNSPSSYQAYSQMAISRSEFPQRQKALLALDEQGGDQPENLAMPTKSNPVPSTVSLSTPSNNAFRPSAPVLENCPSTSAGPSTTQASKQGPRSLGGTLSSKGTGTSEKTCTPGREEHGASTSSTVPTKKRCNEVSSEIGKPVKRATYVRKGRPSLEDLENMVLERYYRQTAFPDPLQTKHIADHLSRLTVDVSKWFENRRQEEKRQFLSYRPPVPQVPYYQPEYFPFPGYTPPPLGYFPPVNMPTFPMNLSYHPPMTFGMPLER